MRTTPVESFYQHRRAELFSRGSKTAAWVFFSPPIYNRNNIVNYPFRQDSNYYFLTGFDEDSSISILSFDAQTDKPVWTMFVQPRNPHKELWEGEIYGVERVGELFGVDQAHAITAFENVAPGLLKDVDQIYYKLGFVPQQDAQLHRVIRQAVQLNGRTGKVYPTIDDPQKILGHVRQIKSNEEIELLRQACRGSALAHKEVIASIKPGMNEREVSGMMDYLLQKSGCKRNSYGSIVAGGKNATCLHYNANDQPCVDGDLMLLDAAGEFGYYAADITRTYPIGNTFSKEQEALYDIVLHVQKEAIKGVKPGATFVTLQAQAIDSLTQGMIDLGLVNENKDSFIAQRKYMSFFPHNLGHWLGIDPHDVGSYYQGDQPLPFAAGMILTIEPGIYIQPDDQTYPEAYRGIGIRIEDNILVTADGYENLSIDAPKEKADILALRK